MAKKAVNYDTEIKVYQYEPDMGVMKKVNRREGTGSTCVFKEVFQNVVCYDCKLNIPMSTKKSICESHENQHLSDKFTAGR